MPSLSLTHGSASWMTATSWPHAMAWPENAATAGVEDQADRLFRWESLAVPPPENAAPYTLQWFLAMEHLRHERQARWLPRLLEFGKHGGETFLGLGHGLGTDWVPYARNGARVIACTPVASELALIRRNFELRQLTARFLHAEPTHLPLPDNGIDVACISGLLHLASHPDWIIEEIYRVLKPGGKVIAVVPAKYDWNFYARFWWPWRLPDVKSLRANPWQPDADGMVYSARRLKKLFTFFGNHRIYKRQLTRKEIPWFWRWIPRDWLQRAYGHFLVIKAFKPVMVSMPQLAAA